jgi:phosphatidate cytidylyltransferase
MKKTVQRLLIFFIGMPLLVTLVLFLPQRHHLAFNIFALICIITGTMEFQNILKQKGFFIPTIEAVFLGTFGPLVMTVLISLDIQIFWPYPAAVILCASWLIVSHIFVPENKLTDFLPRTAAGFSVIIYPGLFMVWIIRMTLWPAAGWAILVYLLMVLLNDAAAWLSGMLWGKGNRGLIPASPNKSVAGFIGGLWASTTLGILAVCFIPQGFVSTCSVPSIAAGAILGFFSGFAAILGDLGESCLKRSAGVKDSGYFIPGRGGMLDSLDSITLAAPVYYLLYAFLFG